MFCDRFQAPDRPYKPVFVENKLGQGVAILCAAADYPGHPAVYPMYSVAAKALLTASHANADLKVEGSDRVRYSLFFDDRTGEEMLCFLNTSVYKNCVGYVYKGKKEELLLAPLELRVVRFPAQ